MKMENTAFVLNKETEALKNINTKTNYRQH